MSRRRLAPRCRIRGWLGQQAGVADRAQKKADALVGKAIEQGRHVAFKEAADHLAPERVSKKLAALKAARKEVAK